MSWYKSFYTKDYTYGISFEIFPKSAKELEKDYGIKAYKTGLRKWTDSCGGKFYALIIHTFRIIIWTPNKNWGGDCCYFKESEWVDPDKA